MASGWSARRLAVLVRKRVTAAVTTCGVCLAASTARTPVCLAASTARTPVCLAALAAAAAFCRAVARPPVVAAAELRRLAHLRAAARAVAIATAATVHGHRRWGGRLLRVLLRRGRWIIAAPSSWADAWMILPSGLQGTVRAAARRLAHPRVCWLLGPRGG